MANNIFKQFGSAQNPANIFFQKAQELRNSLKNPRGEVEKLLASGQMTQEQFNMFAQQAREIIAHFPDK